MKGVIKVALKAGFVWISGMWIAHGVAETLKEWNDMADICNEEEAVKIEFEKDAGTVFQRQIGMYREFGHEIKRYYENLMKGKIEMGS